jgi:hypothetical protein
VIWLEECPDVLDALGDKGLDTFMRVLKAVRSAGGTVVMSLQRSDYSQMPTLARGQLANLTFGVNNSHDAAFGLSDAQDDAGARPELWSNKQPGMAYLDAPSIPGERIAMPLRTFEWGKDGKAMREHCALFPAASKALDEFTAAIVGTTPTVTVARDDQDAQDDDEAFNPETAIETPDPDPSLTAGLDDEIEDEEDDEPFQFAKPEPKMSPEQARALVLGQLAAWIDEGREDFTTRDLRPIWEKAGMTRQWAQGFLGKLRNDGVIGYEDVEQRHTLLQRPETA